MVQGQTCCCCCSVRNGTMIIAILGVVFWTYGVASQIYYFAVLWNSESGQVMPQLYPARDFVMRLFTENGYRTFMLINHVIAVVLNGINFVLNIILFLGALKEEKAKCIPWLYFNAFVVALFVINGVAATILTTLLLHPLVGVFIAFFFGIIILVWGYCLNVVRRYVLELTDPGYGGAGHVYFSPASSNVAQTFYYA